MSKSLGATVGARIARYRQLNGQSAEELAAATGGAVSRSVIANLENDRKSDLSVSQLLALSSALGVPPAALLFDIKAPFSMVETLVEPDGRRRAMHVIKAIEWVGGSVTPTRSYLTPAGRDAWDVLELLRDYQRFSLQREELEKAIDRHRAASGDQTRVAEFEGYLQRARNELQTIERKLVGYGVDLSMGEFDRRTLWDWRPDFGELSEQR